MKLVRILIVTTLVVIVFFTGAWCGIRFYSYVLGDAPYLASAAQVTHAYAALFTLRKGDTETTASRLESSLNSGLLGLTTMEQMRDCTPKTQIKHLLGQIKTYRQEYPFSENQIIDDAVAKVLALADEEK